MPREIYSERREGGVSTSLHRDGKVWIARTWQDVRAILEQNRRDQAAYDPNPERRTGGWRKVASIPIVVWQQFRLMGIVDAQGRITDERRFWRLLSDIELRNLRTDNGRRLA